ncbi:hypothetical protein MMC17_009685 [Xylographa soralifera]|nr:hypothetical protein [Xylographa soralifera]
MNSGLTQYLVTKKVSYGTIKYKGHTIRLIDTPGFDDSDVNDSTILKEISNWLLEAFYHKPPLLLSGVIYLHPITNVRMKGTDKTNLAMFQALCGKGSLACVVIATTMWSKIDIEAGKSRQKNLSDNYWNNFIDAGTTVMKHRDTKDSALALVDRILQQNTHIVLSIQDELSSGMQLSDTGAGRELGHRLNEERKKVKDRLTKTKANFEDALQRSDDEDVREIFEKRLQYQREIHAKERELKSMEVNMQILLRERQEKIQHGKANLDAQRQANDNKLSNLTQILNSVTVNQQEPEAETSSRLKFESMSTNALLEAQTKQHNLQMQLEADKHKREMEEERKHREMLADGAKWGKVEAVADIGGVGVAIASLAQGCAQM